MENLGRKGKDIVTGFEGVIISLIHYLTGCSQYGITPLAKDGDIKDSRYFDISRVEVGERVMEMNKTSEEKMVDNGGPENGPKGRY